MTTKVTGSTYTGIIDEILDARVKGYGLGNDATGNNSLVVLKDTRLGTEWNTPDARLRIILHERDRSIDLIARNGLFTGGEGRRIEFRHTLYQENHIEVSWSRSERR